MSYTTVAPSYQPYTFFLSLEWIRVSRLFRLGVLGEGGQVAECNHGRHDNDPMP